MSACRCLPVLQLLWKVAGRILCLWRTYRDCRNCTRAVSPSAGFVKQLEDAGYELDYRPIKLAKFGIPQSRRRLVLVGSRHGMVHLPEETHGPGAPNERYATVRDWIAHLPPIQAGEEHQDIPNHRAANLSARNLERIVATPEGGGNRDWPTGTDA